MIKTLQNFDELKKCRQQLAEKDLDFTQAGRLTLWTSLYNLRYRFRSTPPIPDFMKSWDVYNAHDIISKHITDKSAAILDMGCFNSEILLALHASGYRNLHGIDLNPHCRWMPFWHKIRYSCGNLMDVKYEENKFAAITCVSVIEHGVQIKDFATECYRLLQPGGLLILTTDYDANNSHNIDKDFRVFNQPWRIFDLAGLDELIEEFNKYNFSLLDQQAANTSHSATPISWNGEDYTFTLLVLKKNES